MMRVFVEQTDRMRVAPLRAAQLQSKRANGGTRYMQAPACGNPRCGGECRLCSADAASAALVPDEAGDETAKLGRAIVKAHKREVRRSATPAIVKRSAAYTYQQEGALIDALGRDRAAREIRAHNASRKADVDVLRSAGQARTQTRRARIARQATIDAAAFRRSVDASRDAPVPPPVPVPQPTIIRGDAAAMLARAGGALTGDALRLAVAVYRDSLES